jgi:capsular polysaccharide biosynthesis protein
LNQRIENLNFLEVIHILKKHMWMIILTAIIFGAVGYAASRFIITPVYESDATLIVNSGQNNQAATATFDQVSMAQQLVGTYAIILKSTTVLNQVIEDMNLNITSNELAKKITIVGVNQTEVIDLSVKDTDPRMAAGIANDIIKVAPDIIIKTVKAGSVEIISPAKTNFKPVSPIKMLNTLIALLLGILISAIISVLMEVMNNTFTSDEDIQKYFGSSVLGIIPSFEIKTKN